MFKTDYQQGQKMTEFLTFKKRDENSKPGRPAGVFSCVCGKEFTSRFDAIKNGKTKSCGCKSKELIIKASTKHEEAKFHESGVKLMPKLRPEDIKRFWAKVDCDSNLHHCWNWTATGERYGHFKVGKFDYKSHRMAYYLHYDIDPKGMTVMHTCDNVKCCNPTHLDLGTQYDNMQDMAEKDRAKSNEDKLSALNEGKVREMRRLWAQGETKEKLAFIFGVSTRAVHSIVNGLSWTHIL